MLGNYNIVWIWSKRKSLEVLKMISRTWWSSWINERRKKILKLLLSFDVLHAVWGRCIEYRRRVFLIIETTEVKSKYQSRSHIKYIFVFGFLQETISKDEIKNSTCGCWYAKWFPDWQSCLERLPRATGILNKVLSLSLKYAMRFK